MKMNIETEIQERIKKQIIKLNSSDFCKKVEELVEEKNISYLEAILEIMEESEYEPEQIAKLISLQIKANIQKDAEDLLLVKKTNNRLDDII